ncbi:MAG: signal peptide peptidase SppA [Anaerolineae bacterium]|nr:signal peptide peptidase SppA [Anaerolineae bacterium]
MVSHQDGTRENATAHASRPRKSRVWLWIGSVGAVLVVVWGLGLCALLGIVSGAGNRSVAPVGGNAVGVIYIEGTIGVSISGANGVSGETILEYIKQAESDRRVKAIVVFINSPGGTVVPSAEVYQALREAQKPVVAAMGDVAASGGYYIACGADKIIAHPATVTGSIGVYGQLINAADLFDKLGIEGIIVRSGKSKAAGNLFEHPTDEQLAIEQELVDELYDLFVSAVAEGRGMDEAAVRELADGRPYTGQQALQLGLVDALGSLPDAITEAAQMANIEGEPRVVQYRRVPSLLEVWLGARESNLGDLAIVEWLDAQYALPQARYVGP